MLCRNRSARLAAVSLLCMMGIARAATLTPGDFDHSMKITFSGYTRSTALTNFPVLVKLDPRAAGFSYADFASSDGADLRFADDDGVTELSYEIEEWHTNGVSSVWVQVPELVGTGADSIHAYWGNSSGLSWNGATFDPSSDISDCVLWLHGGTGVQTDGAGNVTGWLDQSGNGNNFSQAVAAEQPTYQADVINGHAAVRFDDSNDGMTSSLNLASPYTVIIVFNCQIDSQNYSRAIQGSNNWLIGPWQNEIVHYAGGWVNAYDLKRPNQFYTCVARNTGAASSFHVDGANRTSGAGNTGSPGTLGLACEGLYAEPLGGDIAEVIVHTRALTDDEHNRVGRYLSEKYALETHFSNPDAPAYATDGSTWSEGFVGVWHMTQSSTDPADSTSYGQDGVNNGLTTQVPGRIADCYEVDSDGDHLLIPHVRNTAFSASLWYYYSSVSDDGWNTVLGRAGDKYHHLLINDGTRHVGFYNSDNGNFNDSGVTLGLNQWHHLAIAVDGTGLIGGAQDFPTGNNWLALPAGLSGAGGGILTLAKEGNGTLTLTGQSSHSRVVVDGGPPLPRRQRT